MAVLCIGDWTSSAGVFAQRLLSSSYFPHVGFVLREVVLRVWGVRLCRKLTLPWDRTRVQHRQGCAQQQDTLNGLSDVQEVHAGNTSCST